MKKKIWFGILIFIFVIIFFLSQKEFFGGMKFEVYFLNHDQNMFECENRNMILKKDFDKENILREVIKILFDGPRSKNLLRFDLGDLKILDVNLDEKNKMAEINFSREYKNLENEIFFRSALIWSVTSLDFVDKVEIFVDGKNLAEVIENINFDFFDRENILLNPEISDEKVYRKIFKLYFRKKNKLLAEERKIDIGLNQPEEKYILEQIILGPENNNLESVVPKETKIYDIKTDKDICYISLSDDFLNINKLDLDDQKFAVYGIVNSLTELENINKVQFLIETEKIDKKNLIFDLAKPFERNEKIIGSD
ncbi:MAG: GerMN domain-containing protein [Firmicutes bacterium]|nr:GerMN domain-containing protein [Bacillota bacterium]